MTVRLVRLKLVIVQRALALLVLANVVYLRTPDEELMGAIDLALENVADRRYNDYFIIFKIFATELNSCMFEEMNLIFQFECKH